MVLRQREPATEDFVEEFQATIIPSSIPSEDFIDWKRIDRSLQEYNKQFSFIEELRGLSEDRFKERTADSLMDADDTRKWIDFYFRILGHTRNKYTALEGLWKFQKAQISIDNGEKEVAEELAEVLHDIGLQRIVEDSADVRDHFRGMLVGLEPNKRKNRQGTCFEKEVEERLQTIVQNLQSEGMDVELRAEHTTPYNDDSGQNKKVDFAIFHDGELKIAIEANCYKGGGSKPSEVRRAYNQVSQRMRNDGIGFIWITDGQAWEKSLTNVLRQGYEDITDIYNLHMVDDELEDDIKNHLEEVE